ncbi:MAG: adenine deaminase [Hymenobacteraceae bacterium]|nr:adenine deaminase [Hymenobacteraceae bacterium]
MATPPFTLRGYVADLEARRFRPAELTIAQGRIQHLTELAAGVLPPEAPYLIPGIVDAHVHVESSLLTPAEFARLAVAHGTVGTVSDPHEIANVLGVAGVQFMLRDAERVPGFAFVFGAPSCVPATVFETAGATVSLADIETLFADPRIGYLAEMMNWPGVLFGDADVAAKIALAHRENRPVDGHAPGLRGEQARAYAAAGISTDHECFTEEEALDKLAAGMHILIREGSAARNFDALIGLLADPRWQDRLMFCSDDKHPDTLAVNHLDDLVRRALARGLDVWAVLRAACRNPVRHYGLPVGLLRASDRADFLVLDEAPSAALRVRQTWLNGELVAENGVSLLVPAPATQAAPNFFVAEPRVATDFRLALPAGTAAAQVRVIVAEDGQLVTGEVLETIAGVAGSIEADPARDLLKIVVVNRYVPRAPVAVAFVRGIGLTRGAVASSVAHDSHNIVAVGCSDEEICRAVNLVIAAHGGLAATDGATDHVLPLPVAGLMSAADGYEIAAAYTQLDTFSKETLGSPLRAPFMTVSFLALLVIPALKLSDKGLFDGARFAFVDVIAD